MDLKTARLSRQIARNLLNLRYSKKLTQQMLAQKSGIPQATIAKSESGLENLTLKTMSKIADALDIDIESLFEFTESPIEFLKNYELKHFLRANNLALITEILKNRSRKIDFKRIEIKGKSALKLLGELQTTKIIFLEEGDIYVRVQGQLNHLQKGDLIQFKAEEDHQIYTDTKKSIIFSLTISK